MSSETQSRDNLGNESKLLRSNADFLRYVGALDSDGTWRWSDAEDCQNAELRKFRQSSIVEITHIEATRSAATGQKYIEEYRLEPHARDYLRQHIEDRQTLCPCGHAGIENKGDHYVCGFALCEQKFKRSEVNT